MASHSMDGTSRSILPGRARTARLVVVVAAAAAGAGHVETTEAVVVVVVVAGAAGAIATSAHCFQGNSGPAGSGPLLFRWRSPLLNSGECHKIQTSQHRSKLDGRAY